MSKAISHTRDDVIRWGVWKLLYAISIVTVMPPLRLQVKRHVKFPRRGPLLLVGNHPSAWDPIIAGFSARRQVHNLGTDQLLRVPYFGWMMPYFSMIPFKKGMRNRSALVELERRVRRGDCCMIFAEGDRTWTGRSNPIKPGIGRMVKRLGAPVGFVKITTGHLMWPRWAKYPRSIPLVVEHVALKDYPESATPEEIIADVDRYVSVDPYEIELPKRSFGRRLAWGFPEFMWSCPHCFHEDGVALVEGDHDAVHCEACGSIWRVGLDCWMRGEGGPAEDMHIDEGYARIVEHFGVLPLFDKERYASTGIALDGEVELDRIHYGQVEAEHLGRGLLELHADKLRFTDEAGHEAVEVHFDLVKAVLLQVGNKLQIRTEADNYQISPAAHSINMWNYFIKRHLRAFRGG